MQRLQALLLERLDSHWHDLRAARRFQQRERIGRIGLAAARIGTYVARGQQRDPSLHPTCYSRHLHRNDIPDTIKTVDIAPPRSLKGIAVSSPATSLRQQLTGVMPPITMPFDAQGKLVKGGLRDQIDFIIGQGARAVVAGGSTGEGHTLSEAEFDSAMHEAYESAAGRVPFVAGLIVQSTRDAIERVQRLKGLNIAALQVTPVHYLFKPDADATVRHFREIYDATKTPIIIYNVIPWNYLSVDLMLRIMDEVPGVIGMKQSGGDLKSVSDLLLCCKPDNLVLSGVDALLYPGFCLGMHGAITALTSAVPGVVVKLQKCVQAGDHETARAIHFKLNALWNSLNHDNLPACVKYIQHLQGLPMFEPRAPMMRVTDAQKDAIKKAFKPLLS